MPRILYLIIASVVLSFNAQAQTNYKAFSPAEVNMIADADSSKPMRVLQITNYVDSVFLRMPSLEVKPDASDTILLGFINRLYKTVRAPNSLGVGIAAPQVGIPRRIIWVQRFDKEADQMPFEVYLNPKIVQYSDSTKLTMEGCLSIPDFSSEVKRPCSIVIEYDGLDGLQHRETIEGFTSVIFQHEIDHLDGILYLDHLKKEVYDQRKKDQRSNR